jgi:hypothetical protein
MKSHVIGTMQCARQFLQPQCHLLFSLPLCLLQHIIHLHDNYSHSYFSKTSPILMFLSFCYNDGSPQWSTVLLPVTTLFNCTGYVAVKSFTPTTAKHIVSKGTRIKYKYGAAVKWQWQVKAHPSTISSTTKPTRTSPGLKVPGLYSYKCMHAHTQHLHPLPH